MSAHYRAFFAVLVLTLGAMLLLRWLTRGTTLHDSLERRRNAWLAATAIVFLTPNFVLAMLLLGALYVWQVRKDPHPVGLYLMFLLAVPPWTQDLKGFGPFNQLFALNNFRMMSLVILLPLAANLFLRQGRGALVARSTAGRATDFAVVALALYIVTMYGMEDSVTAIMRRLMLSFLDMILPYFVISRYLRTREALLDALGAMLLGGLIMAVVATFEHFKGWLLFESTMYHWDLDLPFTMFLIRDDRLRAMGTAGHALVLGHYFVICLALLVVFAAQFRQKWRLFALYALVVVGLYSTLSRGPLVAAAVVVVLTGLFSGQVVRYYAALAVTGLVVLGALFFSPFWDRFVAVLPFVGTVELDNVTYRQQLFDATLLMVSQRPLFGSIHVLDYLEHLRQGQGIIDLVNTYAIYAMRYGLIGLGLFLMFLVGGLVFGIEAAVRARGRNEETYRTAGAVSSALLGSMIVIVAVSNIDSVPYVYTALVAVLVAMVRMTRPQRQRRVVLSQGPSAAAPPAVHNPGSAARS
jgi:hypothetical protein